MNKLNIISRSVKSILINQSSIKTINVASVRKLSSETESLEFETLKVTTPHPYVYHVQINRPKKRNAMNVKFFAELTDCFQKLQWNSDCRSIVLSGNGKGFTAGLDVNEFMELNPATGDVGRTAFQIKKMMEEWQRSMSAPEVCHKPVITSTHGFCIGAGIDLISACDIRYCSKDAWFSIKEVDIGLAADIGTLQRFPKIVGNDSLARELIYTARDFSAEEAKQLGFVSKILSDEEACLNESLELAKVIASKSPIAIQGSKINVVKSRDCSVKDGLEFMSAWNIGMIQSEDVVKAAIANMTKEAPEFEKC